MPYNATIKSALRVVYKVETGIFDGVNTITLLTGFGANAQYLTKFIITNTDTANITPVINLHNKLKCGEDDEYIQLMPRVALVPGERMIYTSPVQFFSNQDLEIELETEPLTVQPQYIMVTNNNV